MPVVALAGLFSGPAESEAASISWDFFSGGATDLQGWTSLSGGVMLGPEGTGGGVSASNNGANFGGYAHDGGHVNVLFRSPTFELDGTGNLTFRIEGGGQCCGQGNLPGNESAITIGGNTVNGGGYQGAALRDVLTGNYLLTKRRSGDGGGYENLSWTAGELAPYANNGQIYTVDYVDTYHGGWGWSNFDQVVVPGFLSDGLPELTWNAGASGLWTDATWSGNTPPNFPDATRKAKIDTAYTVTVTGSQAAGKLTTLNDGKVIIGSGNSLTINANVSMASVSTGSALTLESGSTLTLKFGTIASLNGTSATIAVSGSNNTLTVGDSTNSTFSGAITGTGAKLTKAGSGTLTLTGTNTYSGATTVSNGILNTESLASTTGIVLGDTGTAGRLNYTGGVASSAAGITVSAGGGSLYSAGSGTLTLGGTNSGSGNLTIGGAANTTLAKGINLGSGTFTKVDAGTLTIGGSGSAGAATISGGTVIASAAPFGSATVTVDVAGTLKLQPSVAPATSGLQSWYDASTLALADGAAVTAWSDLSGNNRHLVTFEGTPNIKTNVVNGLSAVNFRNESLQQAVASPYFAKDVFVVFRSDNGTNFGPDWGAPIGVKDADDNNRMWMLQGNEDRFWDGEPPAKVVRNGVNISSANNFDMGGINAGQYMLLKVTTGPNSGTHIREMIVGSRTDAWSNSYFDTAEILAFDHELTAGEENQVGFYLKNKYRISSAYTDPTSLGGLSGSGQVDINSTLVTVGSNNASTTFSGALIDSAGGGTVTKTGNGTLTLSGNGTYAGATTVNAGRVQVNSPGTYASTFTVNTATLGGNGTVGGIVLSSTGTLKPGADGTVGTLTTGTLTLASGSVLDYEFSGANSDLINVTQANGLTINGGGFRLYTAGTTNTFSGFGTYNLFQYDTGLTGFGNLSTNSILNKISGVHYNFGNAGGFVQLTISSGPVWNGGGGSSSWATAANWSNVTIETDDTLIYQGNTQLTSNNDQGVTQLRSVVFRNDATGAFTLTGNGITLIGDFDNNLIRNDSTATQTINLGVTVGAAGKFVNTTDGSGSTVLGGNVNNNGNALLITGPGSTTISATGTISGAGGLTKSGNGTLTINAATTFSGDTRIGAGTLSVGHQNALANTTVDMNNADTGSLTFGVSAATLGGLKGTRNIALGGANVSIGANGVATEYKGALSGGTGLTKVGGGVLTLAGTNTYGGDTLISAGTVKLKGGSPGLRGSIFTGTPNNDVPMNLDNSTYQESETRIFTGNKANTVLALQSAAGQDVLINQEINNWNGFPQNGYGDSFVTAFSGSFTPQVSGNHNFHWDNDDRGLMYIDMGNDGVFDPSDKVGNYNWNDNGTRNLTAGTAYSVIYMAQEHGGGQNVNWMFTTPNLSERRVNPAAPEQAEMWTTGGSSNSNIIPDTSLVNIVGGAILDLNGNKETVGPLTGSGNVTLGTSGSSRLTVNSTTGNDTTFAGVISGGGGITKAGPATLTMGGANTFAGDTRVAAGALKIGNSLALQNSTLDMNTADAGMLDMNGTDTTLGGLKGTRGITLAAGKTLSIGNNNSATAYSGVLTGTGSLMKIGTGTSAITGASDYSGSTTIANGVLNVGSGGGLSANSNLSFNGTNPVLEQSGTFSRSVGSGAGQVQWVTGGGFAAFGGALSVQLGGGTGQVAWSGTIGNGNSLVLNSATANNVADFQNALDLGADARTVHVLDNTGSSADWGKISGAISGAGSLVKTGNGRLVLSGSNGFTGGLAIGAGTVQLANAGALNSATPNAVSFTAGTTGTLRLNGNSVTVGGLSTDGGSPGTAIVENAHATAATLNVAGSGSFAGVLQNGTGGGALSLTKSGGGTLSISGANTYTGATMVTGGTLSGNAASLPTNVAVSSGANLTLNQTSDGSFKKVVSGAGSLTKEGGAVLTLGANNTYTGSTVISNGTLKLAGAGLSAPSGLNSWFDAKTLALSNGAAVSTWNDLSGGDHHATQGSGGNQPTFSAASGPNGLPVVQFRNNDDYMPAAGNLFAKEHWAVFRSENPNWSNYFTVYGNAGGDDRSSSYLFENGSQGGFHGNQNPENVWKNGTLNNFSVGPDINQYMVMRLVVNNNNPNPHQYGLNMQGGWRGNFDLAEYLTFDHVLSAEDVDAVGGFLEAKYNIATTYTAGNLEPLDNIPNTSLVSVAGSATLNLNGTAETVGPLSGAGNVTLGGGALTLNSVSSSSFGGLISGGGTLTKKGAGTQTLDGSNSHTYTGQTSVLQGTLSLDFANMGSPVDMIPAGQPLVLGGGKLQVIAKAGSPTSQTVASTTAGAGDSAVEATGGAGETASIVLGAITRQLGGTVDFNNTTMGTIVTSNANTNGILGGWATYADSTWATDSGGGVIGALGTYQSAYSAGNNVDVTGANNSTGTATANSVRFNAGAAETLTLSGTLTLSSGGVLVTPNVGANGTIIGGGTLQADAGKDLVLIQNNTAGTLTINSDIVDDGSSGVTKSGPGVLILGGTNTFGGPLRINDGSVRFAGNSTSGPITFGVGSAGVLQLLGQTITVGGISGDLASPGSAAVENAIASPAGTLIINTISGSYAWGGVLRDGTGSAATNFEKAGAGTQILAGDNTFTGTVLVSGGVLQMGSSGALNSGSPRPVTLTNNGVLRMAGNSVTASSLVGSASTIVENMSATAGLLTVNKTSGTDTFAGILRDGTGTGKMSFTKAGAGTLILTGANTLTGQITVAGGTLQGNTTSLPSAIALAGGNVNFNQTAAGTLTKPVSGTGSFTKSGAETLILDASLSHDGTTFITEGTLRLKASTPVSAGLNAWFAADQGVTLSGSQITNWADLSGNGRHATAAGGVTNLATNQLNGLPVAQFRNTRITLGGSTMSSKQEYIVFKSAYGTNFGPSWGAPFGKQSDDHWMFQDNNRRVWDQHVPIAMSQNGYVVNPNDRFVQLGEGGNYAAVNQYMVLKVDTSTGSHNLSSFVLGDNGQWGNSLFDVAEVISYNRVLTAGEEALVGGYLESKYDIATAYAANPGSSLSAGSAVVLSSGATLDVNGVKSTSGALSGPADSFVTLGTANLTVNSNSDTTFAGVISGNGTFTKTGPNTQTLTGINTHTVATAINGGTLAVSDDSALGGGAATLKFNGGTLKTLAGITTSRSVVVDAGGGTVNTNGFDVFFDGALSGTGALGKSGSGTLTLTGTSTMSGTANVSGGTLKGSTSNLKTAFVMSNGANVAFDQSSNGSYGKQISGTGNLVKEGGGVLTIGTAQTYNGSTLISGGTLKMQGVQNLTYNFESGDLTGWTNVPYTGGGTGDSFTGGHQPVTNVNGNEAITGNWTVNTWRQANPNGASDNYTGIIETESFNVGASSSISFKIASAPGQFPFTGDPDSPAANMTTFTLEREVAPGNWEMVFNKNHAENWDMETVNWDTSAQAGQTLRMRVYDTSTGGWGHIAVDDIMVTGASAGADNLLPITTAVKMASDTTLDLNSVNQQIGSLADVDGGPTNHQVLLGTATLTVGDTTSTTFTGAISGDGSLVKVGSGSLTLNGALTYAGSTTVNDGTLFLGGSLTGSVTVNDGGTLGGATGAPGSNVGGVTVHDGGTLAPGASTGIINVLGNLTLDSGATFAVEINNWNNGAGIGYDQVQVTGDVSLNGAILALSGAYGPGFQTDIFTIILNNGVNDISGTFSGLANGAIAYASNGQAYQISYFDDISTLFDLELSGSNNVSLLAVPEPGSMATILGGLGMLLTLQRRRRRA